MSDGFELVRRKVTRGTDQVRDGRTLPLLAVFAYLMPTQVRTALRQFLVVTSPECTALRGLDNPELLAVLASDPCRRPAAPGALFSDSWISVFRVDLDAHSAVRPL